jgi:hypothetical protein
MPVSRRLWGWFVFALGLLWSLGGFLGALQGNWRMWLMFVLGLGLLRFGYNLSSGVKDDVQ